MPALPLQELNVVEFAGLAPGPFAGLVLADWGATVTRIDKVDQDISTDVLCRDKRSLAINSKIPSGLAALRKLIMKADVVIDPFRPGVLEKLGLGPDVFVGENGLNQRLVFARLAGFPRKGAYKDMAGHDINYIALSGVLSMLPGTLDRPSFPLNLLADFAGGGLMCALGILLALIERGKSGRGQVVNVDMVSGSRYISSFPLLHSLFPSSYFSGHRMTNVLDGGAPFYDIYTCSDGRWMSVGCLEPQFFSCFLKHFSKALPVGFTGTVHWNPGLEVQVDRDQWPQLREYLTRGFKTNTRDYWAKVFYDTDSCTVPVLNPEEAAVLDISRSCIPRPHPELTRTPSGSGKAPGSMSSQILRPGQHTEEVLKELGLSDGERRKLALDGALGMKLRIEAGSSSKL